ncbi:MAG TPA: hypothetical protein VGF44_16665 [Terriglobales bacterium]
MRFSLQSLLAFLVSCIAISCGGGAKGDLSGPAQPGPPSAITVTCSVTQVETGLTDQCSSTNSAVTWMASAGTISSSGVFTAPGNTGAVTITATSTTDATKSGIATLTITQAPQPNSGFVYTGITHVSWSTGEYSSSAGTSAQDAMAATGGAWAGVLATQYMQTKTSNTIATPTPSDADVIAAIHEFHSKGMKVMLKPHVDVMDGTWRGQIAPSDVTAWFQSFTIFITHYAQLAQDNGVEMLCFGTEYASMSGSQNQASWDNVITAIRAIYTGPLVYAANATFAGDEFTSVSFWDKMDVIGLDAYFPLTNHSDPTVAQLVAAWSNNTNGENILANIQNFSDAHPGKPLIFTEIGYRSAAGTNTKPFDFSFTAPADDTEQQNCYEAMYEVWSGQSTWMKGNFWWGWPVPAPSPTDTDYNPRNKPAQTILQNWQ